MSEFSIVTSKGYLFVVQAANAADANDRVNSHPQSSFGAPVAIFEGSIVGRMISCRGVIRL